MNDPVSREAAKAAVTEAIAEEFGNWKGLSLEDSCERGSFQNLTTLLVRSSLDALPAAEDGRWVELKAFVNNRLAMDFIHPDYMSACVDIYALMENIEANPLPAAPNAEKPEGDKPPRPPMLYATVVGVAAKEQAWTRCGSVWQLVDGEERIASTRFQSVCVYKSAPEAFRLFHEDLSRPACGASS